MTKQNLMCATAVVKLKKTTYVFAIAIHKLEPHNNVEQLQHYSDDLEMK